MLLRPMGFDRATSLTHSIEVEKAIRSMTLVTKHDYRREIDFLRSAEEPSGSEFLTRVFLAVGAVSTAWLLLGLWVLPVWILGYYGLVWIEKVLLLTFPEADSIWFFGVLIATAAMTASVFVFLPYYLWLQPNLLYKFGAIVLLVGGSLNVFLVRARVWQVTTAYVIPFGACFIAISLTFYEPPNGGVKFVAALVIALAMVGYFLIAVVESHGLQKRLAQTRDQLSHAQKMEAIGNVTGGVAHDFSNLLSVVRGNLEALRRQDNLPDQAQQAINESILACDRGAGLTRKMLAIGRRAELQPARLDPHRVLVDTLTLCRPVLPANIAIETISAAEDLAVVVDASSLQTALLNLVINARDAMPNGGRLKLSCTPCTPDSCNLVDMGPGDFLKIEVQDTGHGIPKDIIDRVFEPFFSTKPLDDASGMGLAMVHGFVRQSGGTVSIESEIGLGTVVALYLPASSKTSTAPSTEVNTTSLDQEAIWSTPRAILFVEDEPLVRRSVTRQLSLLGHEVNAVSSAEEALAVFLKGPTPDLVLTDVVLPGGMQGPDLARKVRSRSPDTPVIFLSGYAEGTGAWGDDDIRATPFLQKPVRLQDLQREIDNTPFSRLH
jgi:signal transduction histidine kinase/CheY-like chemotaxis protein